MTIPYITPAQYDAIHPMSGTSYLMTINKAIDAANAKAAEPISADPHATLCARHAQQVKDGTVWDYVWEWQYQGGDWQSTPTPMFSTYYEYRCTPKPRTTVNNISMTVEKAKALFEKTKGTHDWTYVEPLGQTGAMYAHWDFLSGFNESPEDGYTYIPKQPKLKMIDWAAMPIGVITNKGEFRGVFDSSSMGVCADILGTTSNNTGVALTCPPTSDLRLAPSGEQKWIAVQDGEIFKAPQGVLVSVRYNAGCTKPSESVASFKVVGLIDGYTDDPAKREQA